MIPSLHPADVRTDIIAEWGSTSLVVSDRVLVSHQYPINPPFKSSMYFGTLVMVNHRTGCLTASSYISVGN
jgi:hypothetical protein